MPYLGKSPSFGVRQRYQYTATASQTTFSGTDTANLTLNYTDNNFVDVFQNGVLLKGGGTDYTATSGTSVVLATGASVSDVIEIIVYDVFSVGNFYNRTDSDSRYVNVDGDSMTGALTITLDNNDTQLTLKSTDADANVGPFLDLNRDSGSPADGDFLGKIQFSGDDDGGNKLNYAFIDSKILDASNGSEDGQLDFYTAVAGSSVSRMQLGSETVFNQDSVDVDFRVESNGDANMFFVDAGNDRVGIGTNAPNNPLDIVASNDGFAVRITNNNDSSGGILVRTSDNDTDQFLLNLQTSSSATGTDYASQLVVNKAGNMSIGHTTMDNARLDVRTSHATESVCKFTADSTANVAAVIIKHDRVDGSDTGTIMNFQKQNGASGGSITMTTSSTSYNTSSDYRLKENVITDWDATARLKQLKPSRFNFKEAKDTTMDGFLAHEVSSIVPVAVTGEKDAVDKDGNIEPQGIDYSKIVPLLTKALQESIARADALEARIKKLEDG